MSQTTIVVIVIIVVIVLSCCSCLSSISGFELMSSQKPAEDEDDVIEDKNSSKSRRSRLFDTNRLKPTSRLTALKSNISGSKEDTEDVAPSDSEPSCWRNIGSGWQPQSSLSRMSSCKQSMKRNGLDMCYKWNVGKPDDPDCLKLLPKCNVKGVAIPAPWYQNPKDENMCYAPIPQDCCTPDKTDGCRKSFDGLDTAGVQEWVKRCNPAAKKGCYEYLPKESESVGGSLSVDGWKFNSNIKTESDCNKRGESCAKADDSNVRRCTKYTNSKPKPVPDID
jgi:hypothetical protein